MTSASERLRSRLLPPSAAFRLAEGGSKPFRESVNGVVDAWLGDLAGRPWKELGNAPSLKWVITFECGRFVAQTLALELNLARACGALKGASSRAKYRSFVDGAASDTYLDYIVSKYPALSEVLIRRVESGAAFHRLVLRAWHEDRVDIARTLGQEGGDVVDIRPLGDPHRGGLRASEVILDSGQSVLFKPSSAAPARFMQQLSAILADAADPPIRVPSLVARRSYHWQELVPQAGTSELDPHAFGSGLAVAHFASAADLHFENVTIKDGTLVALDCEAVLGSRPLEPDQIDLLQNDLSITALLPRLMSGGQGVIGPNWGFWGGNHRIFHGIPDFETLDDETDFLKYVQHRRVEPVQTWDRDSVAVTWDTLEDVLDAFESQFRNICARADLLTALIRRAAGRGLRGRVVMRPTQSYIDVLSRSSHPSHLLSWASYARSVRSALIELGGSLRLASLVDREVHSLLRGDIPAFWARCDSEQLLGCPLASGVGQALRRIDEAVAWPDRMVSLYRSDITSHIAAYVINDLVVRDVPPRGRLLTDSGQEASLHDGLRRSIRQIEESAWPGTIDSWVNVHRTGTGTWRRERSGVDLYSGSTGVHFALSQLEDPNQASTMFRIDALRRVLDAHRFTRPGAFDGQAGAIYALASVSSLAKLDDAHADGIRSSLLRGIERMAPLVEKDDSGDIISGSAGALAVLAGLVESRELEMSDVAGLGELCVDRIARLAQETTNGRIVWVQRRNSSGLEDEWHGGFAHGVAGIAWALRRWSALTGTPLALELAAGAEATQESLRRSEFDWDPHRTLFSDGEGRSGWCYGAEGVILARLDSGLMAEETREPGWYESLVSRLSATDQSEDLCICHGQAGRLVLWSRLARAATTVIGEVPEPLAAQLARDSAWLAQQLDRPIHPLASPFSRWSSSLMLGDSGVVHAIRSTLSPHASVLLLEVGQSAHLDERGDSVA